MKVLKFAAIDIGSNAVRLLFTNVIEDGKRPTFKKSSLVRIPLRLGEDAFTLGKITDRRIDKLVKTMTAFKHLMEVQEVVAYRACATSAMREASNSAEIVERVKRESGIAIEVIDGKQEAEIIYSNQIVEMLNDDKTYIYVDVGGGSTELTVFAKRQMETSRSFNIGTLRMLNKKVTKGHFDELKAWIKEQNLDTRETSVIGSGGNINKILKVSGKKDLQQLEFDELKEIHRFVSYYSVDERIKTLGMNPDRAFVIVPAAKIFLKVMKWSGSKKVIIPTIGVSDGIVHQIYHDYKGR